MQRANISWSYVVSRANRQPARFQQIADDGRREPVPGRGTGCGIKKNTGVMPQGSVCALPYRLNVSSHCQPLKRIGKAADR